MDNIKRIMRVDGQTGEVYYSKEEYQTPAFDEEKGYLFWARKKAAKTFADVTFPQGMNDLEIGRMVRLSKRIWGKTNMLGYRGNGGVRPYNIDQIGEVIGLKSRQTHAFVTKMLKLGILARVVVECEGVKETQFYVSPIYFFSGNRIPLNLYLIFREQLDAILPEWVKQRFDEQGKKK